MREVATMRLTANSATAFVLMVPAVVVIPGPLLSRLDFVAFVAQHFAFRKFNVPTKLCP